MVRFLSVALAAALLATALVPAVCETLFPAVRSSALLAQEAPLPAAPPPEPVPMPVTGPGGVEWVTPAAGLARAAVERRAMLVAVGDELWTQLDTRLLDTPSVRKHLAELVVIDARRPASQAPLLPILGDLSAAPGLYLLDFRTTLLERWREGLPRRAAFARGLTRALERNAELARRVQAVQQAIDKARYALEEKQTAKACEYFLVARSLLVAPEDPLRAPLNEVHARLEAGFRALDEKGRELEERKLYVEAVESYTRLRAAYPLPEWSAELDRRIARLWTLIRQ